MIKHTPKELGSYIVHPTSGIESRSGWRGTDTRFITQMPNDDGYMCVRLVLNGKRKKWRVHRLMAELFLGPRPSQEHQIRHLDGNKRNNAVENLAWGTAKENSEDREAHGRTSRGAPHKEAIRAGIERAKIDARLISAAPDLLAALDRAHLQIVELLNEGDFKRKVVLDLGYIVDAIAKAEGRK